MEEGSRGGRGGRGEKGRPPIEEDGGRFFCCSKEGEGSHGDTGSAEDAEDECLWQEQVYLRR